MSGRLDVSQETGAAGTRRATVVLLVIWLGVALVGTLALHRTLHGRPYDYAHAWVSAHFSTMARSFVEHGVLALGGVPVQNNPPLGRQPDSYIHWPPLFPIILAGAFHTFGESEAVAHGLALIVLLGNAAVIGALTASVAGPRAGLFAAFSWLALPITGRYGHGVIHLNAALLGLLLAILGFVRATAGRVVRLGWAVGGAAALALAVLTSWEPLLACVGLVAVAGWQRHRARLALAAGYTLVGGAAAVGVLGLFLLNSPDLASDLWETLRVRTGLGRFRHERFLVHTLVNELEYARYPRLTPLTVLGGYVGRVDTLGPLGMLAVSAALVTGWWRCRDADRGGSLAVAVGGLFAPWVLWFALMANHASVHEYEMLLAAPVTAVTLGVGAAALLKAAEAAPTASVLVSVRWSLLLVVPAVMLLPLSRGLRDWVAPRSGRLVTFARSVERHTERGAVVLTPNHSMVPVYYSRRHVIRGVASDGIVESIVTRLDEFFPCAPVYLALDPADVGAFPRALARFSRAAANPEMVLLAVSGPASYTESGTSSLAHCAEEAH